jgi:hypothetical protein
MHAESQQSFLPGMDFFWERSLALRETKQLFAVPKPRALRYEAVLPRDPFLDLLVGGALTEWLLLAEMTRRGLTSPIVIACAH